MLLVILTEAAPPSPIRNCLTDIQHILEFALQAVCRQSDSDRPACINFRAAREPQFVTSGLMTRPYD